MDVPTSEVGYTSATARRGDHESSYENVVAFEIKKVHVTMHRNRIILNNQPDTIIIQIYSVIKLYMFRASSVPIIRSFLMYSSTAIPS